MDIKKAEFLTSNTDYKKCPAPDKPEYAFIGRSNVGKSSLINMLTGFSGLAKVSGKPGKTQLINHFIINDTWYLVDLPGYGWARITRTEREKWDKMVKEYLRERENLQCVFILVDSRHKPQASDLEFMRWLAISGIPFVIIFTKTDKQTKNKTQSLLTQYKKELLKEWEELPQMFSSSAVSKEGKSEITQFINSVNENFTPLSK